MEPIKHEALHQLPRLTVSFDEKIMHENYGGNKFEGSSVFVSLSVDIQPDESEEEAYNRASDVIRPLFERSKQEAIERITDNPTTPSKSPPKRQANRPTRDSAPSLHNPYQR